MVQLRASLEGLVLQAWRERWTELEWILNLKASLTDNQGELNKLCALLLRQATLSEVPNKLMFNYLSYTVAAQVVTHASLLEAILNYRHFERELCIESILDLLNFVRDRLRANSGDGYECEKLCSMLWGTVEWVVEGVEVSVRREQEALLLNLSSTLLAAIHNPFISLCLYFHHLESSENPHAALTAKIGPLMAKMEDTSWVPETVRADFRSFIQKLASVPNLLLEAGRVVVAHDGRERNPSRAHPAIITLAITYGSVRITEAPEEVAAALVSASQAFRLAWWVVLRDFVRGALLLQLDPGPHFPDSGVAAFVYLKIPRVLRLLVEREGIGAADVVKAVEAVAGFHPLLNSLDAKVRSDCFKHLIEEMKKHELFNEAEGAALHEVRNRDKINLSQISPNNQTGLPLVLKAEYTSNTLLKSFNSDMASKYDKLVKMMYHLISGKSFEYICGALAAIDKLEAFVGNLMEFNNNSQNRRDSGDIGEEGGWVVRSAVFDLSFLLLSRIGLHYFPIKRQKDCKVAEGKFVQRWIEAYGNLGKAVVAQREQPRDPPAHSPKAAEITEKLKAGEKFWDPVGVDWGEVCWRITDVAAVLLHDAHANTLSTEDVHSVLRTLEGSLSSLVLCVAQWLVLQPSSPARRFLAHAIQSFLDSPPPPPDINKNVADRWHFLCSATRKWISPLMGPEPVCATPQPFLIHCARRQLPHISLLEVPAGEHLRQTFFFALRQARASACVLAMIDRCSRVQEVNRWTNIWVQETLGLVLMDEMSLACDLVLGVALIASPYAFVSIIQQVVTHVLGSGHDLCVAPRGTLLARFLVQSFLLALRDSHTPRPLPTPPTPLHPPQAKIRKVDGPSSTSSDTDSYSSPITECLKWTFAAFSESCGDGEVRPAIYFIASFLRILSEHKNPASKEVIRYIPKTLLNQVIRTDPKIMPAPSVIALHDLESRNTRQRALQNLCLLRQLGSL